MTFAVRHLRTVSMCGTWALKFGARSVVIKKRKIPVNTQINWTPTAINRKPTTDYRESPNTKTNER